MTAARADFDGLAASYDRARPRYPSGLFSYALELMKPSSPVTVVDAGGGTGIALEALLPLLPEGSEIHGVDLSADMVGIGRSKFPDVRWTIGGSVSRVVHRRPPDRGRPSVSMDGPAAIRAGGGGPATRGRLHDHPEQSGPLRRRVRCRILRRCWRPTRRATAETIAPST